MNLQIRRHQFFPALSAAVLLAACLSGFTGVKAEPVEIGRTVFNACNQLAVLGTPADYRSIIRKLKFGTSIQVTGLFGVYELPATDFDSKINAQRRAEQDDEVRGALPIDPREYTRYTCLVLNGNEFVPANCFVDEALFKQQNKVRSLEKVMAIAFRAGKKGFSEEEDGDLKALKGATGAAIGGKANYPAIDEHLSKRVEMLGSDALKQFMDAGGLE